MFGPAHGFLPAHVMASAPASTTAAEKPPPSAEKKKKAKGELDPAYWAAGGLVLLECAAVATILVVHFLRPAFAIVPLFLFGLAWLHTFTPFCFLATIVAPRDIFVQRGAGVLYLCVVPLDIIGVVLVHVFSGSFGSDGHYFWTAMVQWVFLALGVGVIVVVADAQTRAVRRWKAEPPPDSSKKARGAVATLWKVRLGLWLLFALVSLIRLIASFRSGWHLLGAVPYLWPTPFVIAASGRVPTRAAFVSSYILLALSVLSLAFVTLVGGSLGSAGFGSSSFVFVDVLDFVAIGVGVVMVALDLWLIGELSALQAEVQKKAKML